MQQIACVMSKHKFQCQHKQVLYHTKQLMPLANIASFSVNQNKDTKQLRPLANIASISDTFFVFCLDNRAMYNTKQSHQ